MLQLTPQSRIFLALEPVDFRRGIDGLAAVCRQRLAQNPLEGAVYVFRNRRATAIKVLFYDGQGFVRRESRSVECSDSRMRTEPVVPSTVL
jgi:transposase